MEKKEQEIDIKVAQSVVRCNLKCGFNLMFTFKTGCNLLKLHICFGFNSFTL